jgi:hypothetical protein
VTLPAADLERLRRLLVEADPGPLSFYPTLLTQLSTRGAAHNFTPIAMDIPSSGGAAARPVPVFRFYFDGLVAHVHRQADDNGETAGLGSAVVGADAKLALGTVPFESSFQSQNMAQLIRESYERFPETTRL